MNRLLALLLLLMPSAALAQGFPSKQVTLVIPYAPGGSSDIMGRAVAQRLSEKWKTPVIIDNRPGGTTTVGTAFAATQPADGHTLLLAAPPFVITAHVYPKLSYEPLRDFRAVSLIAYYPLVTVVPAASPINSLKELIDFARAHPGSPYPSPGAGTTVHLVTELMAREEKIEVVHVPYRSGGQGVNDLIGGRMVFYSGPTTEVLSHVQAGSLRAIATLAGERVKQLPQVPTSAEQGYGRYVATSWSTMVAPAGTPDPIVQQISRDIASVTQDAGFRATLEAQGAVFVASSPDDAKAFLYREDQLWQPVVKAIGLKPEN